MSTTTSTTSRAGRRGAVVAAVAGAGLAVTLGAQLAGPGAQAHAAGSVANIPANVYETLANMPAVQYQALQQTTKAFNDSGNWWLYIPTNVVGFDQQDYEKVAAISLLLMPIPKVAAAQSDQLWMTLATFAPMTPNCTGVPGPCSDPLYFLQYGQVPMWQLLSPEGYTFPEIRNTIDPDSEYYTAADGQQVAIQPWWSGQTVHLDFLGPAKAVWETLTDDPSGKIEQGPTAQQWAQAYGEFGTAVFNGLNPFVDGTYCLPCQLFGTAGAPGSLPKFALFGKYYTAFNLGQKLTEQDWSLNPPSDYDPTDPNREDYVPVTNIWTKAAWDQMFTDGVTSTRDSLALIPQLPTIIPQNLATFGDQLDEFSKLLAHNIVANIDGLATAGGATFGSAEELAEMIKESFVNALPSATTDDNGRTSSTLRSVVPTTAAKTAVTLTADEALRGSKPLASDSKSADQDIPASGPGAEPSAAAPEPGSPEPGSPSTQSPTTASPSPTPPPSTTPDETTSAPAHSTPEHSTPSESEPTESSPDAGQTSSAPSVGKHRADDGSGYTGKHRATTGASSDSGASTSSAGAGGGSTGAAA